MLIIFNKFNLNFKKSWKTLFTNIRNIEVEDYLLKEDLYWRDSSYSIINTTKTKKKQ